jgi:hypothetical protein
LSFKVSVEGVTVTVATGASDTVTVAVPTFPPDDAVMIAEPGNSPSTTPACDTDAVNGLSLDHATGAVITPPLSFRTVAVNVVVDATLMDAVDGATVTLPTGGSVTVTVTVPTFVSLVAVTVVLPGATPVINPACVTVAMLVFALAHVIARPVSAFP